MKKYKRRFILDDEMTYTLLFSSTDDTDGDGLQKYWGPLISQGGNGPSAKPLFTSFKTEGHVSTACLWHACRAVTVGSLLIILGITMAVLGKMRMKLRL